MRLPKHLFLLESDVETGVMWPKFFAFQLHIAILSRVAFYSETHSHLLLPYDPAQSSFEFPCLCLCRKWLEMTVSPREALDFIW